MSDYITSKYIAGEFQVDIPQACGMMSYLTHINAIYAIANKFVCGGQGRGRGAQAYTTSGELGSVVVGLYCIPIDSKADCARLLPVIRQKQFFAYSDFFLKSVGGRAPWASNLTRTLERTGFASIHASEEVTIVKNGKAFSQTKYIWKIMPFFLASNGKVELATKALSRLLRE
jgi:hypothetical protein